MNAIVKQQSQQIAQADQAASLIAMIERAATNPDIDMNKMERLWEMYREEARRVAEVEFNKAMQAAQSEIGRVAADKKNDQTKSMYASYAALDRVVRPVYTTHGFSLSFNTGSTEKADTVLLLCDVSHVGGHTKKYQVEMPADGKGAKGGDVMTKTHAAGSAMQYGQRYLLKLIFNIAIGQDDDGNGASAKAEVITDEQAANMQALLEEVKADKVGFFKYLSTKCKKEIKGFKDIPAVHFQSAMKALEGQRKK